MLQKHQESWKKGGKWPQETGDGRTTFRLHTVGWRCHPSTQSKFLHVVMRARSGGGAWRAQSAGLFRWELGILERCRPASECMTSEHTPPSFSLYTETKRRISLLFPLIIAWCCLWNNCVVVSVCNDSLIWLDLKKNPIYPNKNVSADKCSHHLWHIRIYNI